MKSELDEQIETLALLQVTRELNTSLRKENVLLREQLEESIKQLAEQRRLIDSQNRYIDTLQKKAIMGSISIEYLRTWLQTFESKFEAEKPEITEASDYLTHAKWMREHCGREDHGLIATVQAWYDSQPVK